MSNGGLCLVKIPVEVWTTALRVEPDKPLAEAEALLLTLADETGNLNDLIDAFPKNDFPWPLLVTLEENGFIKIHKDQTITLKEELSEASGTFELIERIREGGLAYRIEVDVVRDLVNGKFHHPSVLKELDSDEIATNIESLESNIQPSTIEEQTGYDSESLIEPVSGRIKSRVKGDDIVKRTRIEAVTNIIQREAVVALRYRASDNNWNIARPIQKFEYSTLRPLAQTVFQPKLVQGHSVSWGPSPELRVLELCNQIVQGNFDDKDLLEYLPILAKETMDEINSSGAIRADYIEVETGTEFHQQHLIKKIISNSRKRCVILSSFLNSEFSDDIAGMLNNTVPQNVAVSLLYGHSEDIGFSEAKDASSSYYNSLKKNKLSKDITISPTKRRTHAKLAINDQGHCWVGSYNLLSGAPGSDTTECGVLIHSIPFSENLIQKLLEWDEGNTDLLKLGQNLANLDDRVFKISEKTYNMVAKACSRPVFQSSDSEDIGKMKYYMGLIIHFFKDISERPVVRVVDTDEHRDVLLELVRDSKEKILIASDRVKKHGLDKALIRLLSRRETRLLWGREDPKAYNKKSKDLTEGIKLVKSLEKSMKQTLLTSFKPMMNHSKLVQVDDGRILITSDNVMSYGDSSVVSDSRQLGVLIDSPRISVMVRGELEFIHKELCFDSWRNFSRFRWRNGATGKNLQYAWLREAQMRWSVALASEVRDFVFGDDAKNAVDMMLNRCFEEDGETNNIHSDFKVVQGKKKIERFIYELIGTAKFFGLLKVPKYKHKMASYFESKDSDYVFNKINAFSLFVPNHTDIWEEGK